MVSCAALDLVWMGLVAGSLYKQYLGPVLRLGKDLNGEHWSAIVLIYVALASGIVFFVVPKATLLSQAGLFGAGLGLVIYGVYELTNYALVAGWVLPVVIIDTLWGAVICGVASLLTYLVSR